MVPEPDSPGDKAVFGSGNIFKSNNVYEHQNAIIPESQNEKDRASATVTAQLSPERTMTNELQDLHK